MVVVLNIRICHECEGGIEQSVTRITTWHHEACRVMTNDDPKGLIFLFFSQTNNGFPFILLMITNKYRNLNFKNGFQKCTNKQRCGMAWCYHFTITMTSLDDRARELINMRVRQPGLDNMGKNFWRRIKYQISLTSMQEIIFSQTRLRFRFFTNAR